MNAWQRRLSAGEVKTQRFAHGSHRDPAGMSKDLGAAQQVRSLPSAPVATVGNGIAVGIAARQFETSNGEPPNGATSRPRADGSFTGIVNAGIGSVVPTSAKPPGREAAEVMRMSRHALPVLEVDLPG